MSLSVSKANQYAVLGPAAGLSASKAVAYAVLDQPTAPSWPSFSFGGGVVGTAYSQSFAAIGSPTITYSVLSGSLPTGLSLSGDTISGTPSAAGSYTFTLRATNDYGTADQPFTLVVSSSGGTDGASGWTF